MTDARHPPGDDAFADMLVDSMPGIFYFYTDDLRFLRWNRNFETVSGYSGEEIARMRPQQFFPEEEHAVLAERVAEVFARGESSMEGSFRTRDGRLIPHFFTGRRVVHEGRTCLVGMGIDISARVEALDLLQASERQYRELVEQANSIILRWNADGRITFLNRFGQQFFGWAADEILGRHVMETIVPPTESGGRDLARLMASICAAPELFGENVNENIRRNGERVWIAWSNRIVRDRDGRVVEFLSIGTDVTARHQAEAEREKRERAEAADRIKSAFLATMSHELRTPLNSILGFTGIVLKGLAGPLNDEQSRQLGMVQSSARHLLELVNDVLDISKIEAGQLPVANEPYDVRASIERVCASVGVQASAKGLALRTSLAPDLGTAVGDARRFEQILLNLLSNAIKFTDRGSVDLVAAPAGATVDGLSEALRVDVIDTGIGIRAEDLPQLFSPFHQIDTGLARQHEGTGLGLAICHRLAGLLGGALDVRSHWGQGSCFTLTLPRHVPGVR